MSAHLEIRIDSDNAAFDGSMDLTKAELCCILDTVKASIMEAYVEEEREMENEPAWLYSGDDGILRDVNGNRVGLYQFDIQIEVTP